MIKQMKKKQPKVGFGLAKQGHSLNLKMLLLLRKKKKLKSILRTLFSKRNK
jgi:hypothetical protein